MFEGKVEIFRWMKFVRGLSGLSLGYAEFKLIRKIDSVGILIAEYKIRVEYLKNS